MSALELLTSIDFGTAITTNTETVEETTITNEDKAKEILNSILEAIPTLDDVQWLQIQQQMKETKSTISKMVYKIASVKILLNIAKSKNWEMAEDGTSIYLYNEEYWIKVEESIIRKFLKDATLKLGVPEVIAGDESFSKHIYKQLLADGFFERMENQDKTLINLENGTLSIDQTGFTLNSFNSSNFLTHQLPFNYNVTEVNQLWLDFLNKVIPDKDTQDTLQQSLGYLLSQNLKLEKAIFLYGKGSNGKSVIFEVLKDVIGEDMFTSYSLESLADSKGYHRAGLQNKLINYGTDISLKKINHGVFKQLVSNEPVEVRLPYKEPFITI